LNIFNYGTFAIIFTKLEAFNDIYIYIYIAWGLLELTETFPRFIFSLSLSLHYFIKLELYDSPFDSKMNKLNHQWKKLVISSGCKGNV